MNRYLVPVLIVLLLLPTPGILLAQDTSYTPDDVNKYIAAINNEVTKLDKIASDFPMKESGTNLVAELNKLKKKFQDTIPNLSKPEIQFEIRWDLSQQWNARKGEIRSFWAMATVLGTLEEKFKTGLLTETDRTEIARIAAEVAGKYVPTAGDDPMGHTDPGAPANAEIEAAKQDAATTRALHKWVAEKDIYAELLEERLQAIKERMKRIKELAKPDA